MHRRNVIVSTNDTEISRRLRGLLEVMDVEAHFLTVALQIALADNRSADLDLVVMEGNRENLDNLAEIENILAVDGATKLCLILQQDSLAKINLPSRAGFDFAVADASDAELQVRLHQLLWPGEEAGSADFIRVSNMTLNLATYQVKVDGLTLDLTYLEYALLAFLVTHPGRTYSRDALLKRVWGFDYYGGSRTVDVHVRRVRSKLGPELAGRLETIRGVGYLWNT